MSTRHEPSFPDLRYPIGDFVMPAGFDAKAALAAADSIASLPADLRRMLAGSKRERLQNTYRPQGWTGLQVLHHMADSHINGLCRTKLALTENHPTIRPYEEQEWALLPDYGVDLIDVSLDLLQALHTKWAYVFRHLDEGQWHRTFYHPGSGKTFALYQHAAHYAWHGRHHLKHIEIALSA
jgi:DinB superfamily